MKKAKLIKLDQWILDPVENRLIKDDNTSIPLEAKYVLLLEFLAQNLNTVISREQLIQAVWENRCVEYRTVNAAISRLRKILGGARDDYIKTHLRKGYSLACQVEYLDKSDLAASTTGQAVNSELTAKSEENSAIRRNNSQTHVPKELNGAKDKLNEQTKKRLLSKSFFKLYSFLCTLFLVIVLWAIFKPQQSTQAILTEQKVNIEPLTYEKGWETSPTLSPDKSLLAYIHRPDISSNYNIVIQNLETKQTITIEAENKTFAPYWSAQSDVLFYMSLDNEQCRIKKIKVNHTPLISAPEIITGCGPYLSQFSMHNLAVSADQNWLYFSSREKESSESTIYRYHLKSQQAEAITSPQGKKQEDGGLRLSPDSSKLAFIRSYEDYSSSVMILDLVSGEVARLHDGNVLGHIISWSKTGSHILFQDEESQILKAINITTKKIVPLLQYTDEPMHSVMISDTEMLVSFGYLYTKDIQQIDLTKKELKLSPFISSSFRDHSAAIFNRGDIKKIAFVSNRSGEYQIWIKEGKTLKQLTRFKEDSVTYGLEFSENAQELLFARDKKLYVVNINSRQIKEIKHSSETIKNMAWLCHSNDNILTTMQEHDNWRLYQINIHTQATKKLATGITSIHSLCNKDSYYVTVENSKGVYRLTNNWQLDNSYHYFPNTNLHLNPTWGVSDNAIYRITHDGEIYQHDFSAIKEKKLAFKELNTPLMNIHDNKILLNSAQVADTFIGKITIPDLQDRLNN